MLCVNKASLKITTKRERSFRIVFDNVPVGYGDKEDLEETIKKIKSSPDVADVEILYTRELL